MPDQMNRAPNPKVIRVFEAVKEKFKKSEQKFTIPGRVYRGRDVSNSLPVCIPGLISYRTVETGRLASLKAAHIIWHTLFGTRRAL